LAESRHSDKPLIRKADGLRDKLDKAAKRILK